MIMHSSSRLFAAVLALLGAGLLQPLDAQSRRDTTFSIDASATVEVVSRSGDITIRSGQAGRVRVLQDSDDRVLVSGSGRALRIESGSTRNRSSDDMEIEVPRGTIMLVRTQNGDISVQGTGADVEVRSTSGDIQVEDAARVRIETVTGDMQLTNITDGVRIGASSGDVTLADVTGDVEIGSTSSDVSMRDVSSRRVQVKVVSGDVRFAGSFSDAGRYEFSTHSGDVRLALPANTRALLDAQTFNGDITTTNLPLTLLPDPNAADREAARERDRERLRTVRDSVRRVVEDSMRDNRNARTRRDSMNWERNLERSVSQLVESVIGGLAAEMSSLASAFEGMSNRRVRRFQIGTAGGPLVSVSTFSGNVIVGSDADRR